MNPVKKSSGFDPDFLWVFNQQEYPAICLSLNYTIIAVTKRAQELFKFKKNLLNKPVNSLFSSVGLEVAFSIRNKKPSVKIFKNPKVNISSLAEVILKLDWQVRSKKISNQIVGWIIYAKEFSLEAIVAVIPGFAYWMNRDCIYLGCNDMYARYLGLKSRKEIFGLSYNDLTKKNKWIKNFMVEWKKENMEVIVSGKAKLKIAENPVILPDGQEIYYIFNRIPLFDQSKKVIGVMGIAFNISECKQKELHFKRICEESERKEKALLSELNREITGQIYSPDTSPAEYIKNVQDYLESIIAGLPGNIYWINRDLVFLGCNNNGAKFLGLDSRKDVVGLSYEKIGKKAPWIIEHIPSWSHENRLVMESGVPKLNIQSGPFVFPGNGDSQIYYLTSRAPLFDSKKNVIGVVVVSIDISEHKKNELLQKEQGIVEKTAAFMKMLAGSIAHELRTPLAIININTDLLLMGLKPKNNSKIEFADAEKCLNSIKHGIKLTSYIIDNMLIMLKTLSSGAQLKKSLRRLSITDDLNKIIESYPFLDHEKPLINVQLNSVKDFVYFGDRTFTQHLLFNLIRNSFRAIKEAEKGMITITLESDENNNILRFTDTALGIPSEELPGIFEQFMAGKKGGAGLGLAFCKMVMQIYGGNISCNSVFGEYTEFVLRFPKVRS